MVEYEKIAPSYKWENASTKNTFDANLWVGALFDVIYRGIKTTDVEYKFVQIMNKNAKSTNGMYINSLLKKMCISNHQDSDAIQKWFTEQEITMWIEERIRDITSTHYLSAVTKAKKWIDEWRDHIAKQQEVVIQKIDDDDLRSYYSKHQKRKIEWGKIQIPNVENLTKVGFSKSKSNGAESNNPLKEKIGHIGEKIFYDQLVSKYGIDKVEWTSKDIDKYSPFDFRVDLKDEIIYFEVKSTTKNNVRFFFSRNEYEFWKQLKSQERYKLITIKNVVPSSNLSFGIIEEIDDPKFEIDMNFFGTKNGKIIISPSNFKGRVGSVENFV